MKETTRPQHRTASQLLARVSATLWVLLLAVRAYAQETNSASENASAAPALPPYMSNIHVRTIDSDQAIIPVNHLLFSYSDSVRFITEGAIVAWGDGGRPLAMAKAWKNPNGTRTCAFSLTSDQLLIARGPLSTTWRPDKIQMEPRELPGGPLPDPQPAGRLRQFKEQARRFTSHEFWNPENSRFELRLLVQPIHRYRDDSRQILDGAVFLMAIDNNPQILLLLEMLQPAGGSPRWQYSLARVSSAELHVAIDGKEVWKQDRTPGIIGRQTDFYWHMVTPEP